MQATSEAITAMYPESDGSSVDLFIYRAELARYLSLGKQIKELEAFQNEAANIIKAYLGEAERGECDGFKASWKSQTRRTFDSKRFMADHKEMDFSDYYKESSTRVLRITEQKGA
jgi:predicted phage-related endonuclease